MKYLRWVARRYLLLAITLTLFVSSCATVPITGRSQLSFIPDSTMLSMSLQEYDQFLQQSTLSEDAEATAMVRDVGARIQGAVEEYFADNNMSQELQNYAWEFNLVESDEVNAWCMPGGKVVVYTGILPITQDETGLAVVMGHEIAHAIAKHGAERMSQQLLVQMGGLGLSVALESEPEETQMLWMTVFNVGAQFGALLPYSRLHESEADYLGLIFMAMAGYDPNEAVDFWGRMAAESGGQAPPEFMSTHPSDETRIRKIEEALPDIMNTYYRPQ